MGALARSEDGHRPGDEPRLDDLGGEEHGIGEDEPAVLFAGGEPGQRPSDKEAPSGNRDLIGYRPDVVVAARPSPRGGEIGVGIPSGGDRDVA